MIYFAHLAGLVLTALISGAVAWWVRRQTHDRAGTVMVALLLAHAFQATVVTAQLLSATPAMQLFWYELWYVAGLTNLALWLLLAVYYTGREYWLTKPIWGLVLGGPIAVGVLWLLNPNELMVTELVVVNEPFQYVRAEFAVGSMWMIGIINLYVLFGFGLFLQQFLSTDRRVRWQAAAVLVGLTVIYVSTILSDTRFVPAPGFPYGLYGSGIYGVIIAVGLFRTRAFAVTPLARDATFEALEDAILVVDARRTIIDFNDHAVDFFPDLGSHIGHRLDDAYPTLVDPDEPTADGDAEAIVDRVEGTLDSPFAGTVRVPVEGETRTLRVSVSDISSGGEPRGYALIMRDITELEAYATELERKTDQLERFATVLSHDLRNPVSVATGYARLARETDDDAHIETVLTALERIDDTIEDLLELSREGESIDDLEPVVLRDVAADAWATSDTGGAVLENDLGETLVRADPSRLRTLLENLFRNAVDHGGERVRVGPLEAESGMADGSGESVERDETGGSIDSDELGFYVADDGPGIPEDERDRVFEYGYSADGGTGLGLAIVASIVDAHGWDIAVTEGEDGGARFEISGLERGSTADRARAE